MPKGINAENFEAYTNLRPLMRNAIELCGKDFVTQLKEQQIHVKEDLFWQEVNKKLNIPEDFARQKQEQEERDREEQRRREQERRRLLFENKKKVFCKERKGWTICVFELPEPVREGDGLYFAECTTEEEELERTFTCRTPNDAYGRACNLVDDWERKMIQLSAFYNEYKIIKPLYLMLLYISGWDEYYLKEFFRMNSWIGLDYNILDYLESEDLITQPQKGRRKGANYVSLSLKGMKEAREILEKINLEGSDYILESRQHHLELIQKEDDGSGELQYEDYE